MNTLLVYPDYLEYVRHTVSFRGIHNRTKTLVLWAINRGAYQPSLIRMVLLGKVSPAGIDASLHRLKRYGYVKQSEVTGVYRLRVKGQRFLWAATKLGHLDRWRAETGQGS